MFNKSLDSQVLDWAGTSATVSTHLCACNVYFRAEFNLGPLLDASQSQLHRLGKVPKEIDRAESSAHLCRYGNFSLIHIKS